LVRSLFLVIVYLAFIGASFTAPFAATLGYVWVDTFRPQEVAYILLNQIPVALIMGLAAIGSYFFTDRRSPPRITLITVLTVMMAIWVTATMTWAIAPDIGWTKWDWAFKTVLFSAFIPFAIRSRVQIEAFLQTYVFSLAGNIVPFGLKTLVSGGGYGRNLGLLNGNSNLAEGGLLSTLCLMSIPLALYLSRHNTLLPRTKLVSLGYVGLAVLALVTALGTFERSALIGLAVLGLILVARSRHKVLFASIGIAIGAALLYLSSAAWLHRMQTISGAGTTEDSGLTRVLVWKWTLGYATEHPLGGGFGTYVASQIQFPDGSIVIGRAFHSIWFEVLGEQGWFGLGIFVGVIVMSLLMLRRASKLARGMQGMTWGVDLAHALQAGLVTFVVCGTFVGIAFQPMFWYFAAMSISLSEYLRRVRTAAVEQTGWRARRTATSLAGAPPWRRPLAGVSGR
jgi:putative inorganic carbon (hco3(-)) transporter